jgi:hypothetical protein
MKSVGQVLLEVCGRKPDFDWRSGRFTGEEDPV